MTTRLPGFLDEKEPVREPIDCIEPGQTTIVASTSASEAGAGPDNGTQAVGRAEAHTSGPARATPLLLDPEEGTPAGLGVQWLPER